MTRGKQILAVLIAFAVMCSGAGLKAYATEPQAAETPPNADGAVLNADGTVETPEQKAERELQAQVYAAPVESNELAGWPEGPGIYGEAGIVMEVGTGAILYAKNIDAQEYPASITKVLTALLALENGQLTDPVTFTHDSIAFLQAGDSSVGMKEGNQITLEQALHATLLASANEAAYAVGESVAVNAGYDYDWFIERMNERCQELGGQNSHFVNTNGLHDPDHYTCARDMALIGRALFQYPDFFRIVQTMEYKIPASPTTEEHVFQQKHKMLIQGNSNYYPYAIGGKTGYTSDALSTLITMGEKDGVQLVCVVLRTHGANIYPDTTNLLEYGFNNFHKVSVADFEESKDVGEILEEDGSGYVMLPEGVEFKDLDLELTPEEGTAGEAVLTYSYEGNPVGTARAKLSKAYAKEHGAKVKDVTSKNGDKEKKTGASQRKTIVVVVAVIGLLLIVWIILAVHKERRRRKSRRRKRRR